MLLCTAGLKTAWVPCKHKLFYYIMNTCHATTVDTLCIGEDELELLCKGNKPCAWVPRRGDQNLRVSFTRMRVFVVDVGSGHRCVVIFQLDIMPQLGFLPSELCRQRLALCKACAEAYEVSQSHQHKHGVGASCVQLACRPSRDR